MADNEVPRGSRKSGGPHYGIELGVLIAVTIMYFVMTCGGGVSL
jgi:hypothetical protein